MEYKLASSYGFCNGVINALKIVKDTVNNNQNSKIFMLNNVVHNQHVVDELKDNGIIILNDKRTLEEKISSIKDGIVIFSAHGHDEKLDIIAKNNNLVIVDAICPKVKYSFSLIKDALKSKTVIFIGIKGHEETEACLSISKNIIFIDYKNPDFNLIKPNTIYSIHNQTTLSQSELNNIYKNILKISPDSEIKNDICFSTLNRQKALEEVKDEDLIIIIGDPSSSNSMRLFEVSNRLYPNKKTLFISDVNEIKTLKLNQYKKCFITAGASTPPQIIKQIVNYIASI